MKNITLKTTLDNCINKNSKEELIKTLEYNNIEIGLKTLAAFLAAKDIYEWLNSGYYDLKNGAEGFLSQLCAYFDLLTNENVEEISAVKDKIRYINTYNNSSFKLEIVTTWIRTVESITMLAIAGRSLKYLNIDKRLFYGLTPEEEMKLVEDKILEHYKNCNGITPIFGEVKYYKYTSEYGKTYRIKINNYKNKPEIIPKSISNTFYFNIIENYKTSLEEIFKIDKLILDKGLEDYSKGKIVLYDFLIEMFNERLIEKYKDTKPNNQKLEKEMNKYIYQLRQLDKINHFNRIFHTLRQQIQLKYLIVKE
jgi:hypothetical protein